VYKDFLITLCIVPMEQAQFYVCPLCRFLEAKLATPYCRFVVLKYSDLDTSKAKFTDAIPLYYDLKNSVKTQPTFIEL
jgi:hypothetical protein